jgi:hypothetical protein
MVQEDVVTVRSEAHHPHRSELTIVYGLPRGVGWHAVTLMAHLAAELLEARLVTVPLSSSARHLRRLAGELPRRRGTGACLVIAPQPQHLPALLNADYVLRGYEHISAWVVDSFWDDRIPGALRRRGHFDLLFVTDPDDVPTWKAAFRRPVGYLPWGADVLRLGSGSADRPVDVLRVGRQPSDWDDDDAVRSALTEVGLVYAGRPPMDDRPEGNQRNLTAALSRAKFTLAFSNQASPASYTHPTRDYLTARWTDALACGSAVAGTAPRSAAAEDLLWPGATLELASTRRRESLPGLVEAVRRWSPAAAEHNHAQARKRLDWRHRFAEFAAYVGVPTRRLQAELDLL